MRILKILVCFALFLPFAITCNGQDDKFTQFQHDSIKFLDDLGVYLNSGIADKSTVKDFVKDFSRTWKTNAYTAYYKRITYQVADEMLVKKMQVYPTFQSFLNVMLNFVRSGLPQSRFDQWDSCFEKQINKKPYTNLNTFLSVSEDIFGSGLIFQSPTVQWSVNSKNYRFNSDSVQEIIFDNLTLKCTNENKDTLLVYNTKGIYSILKGTWKGVGGTTDWTRTGLAASEVYAELKNYNITFKAGGFVADSVTFWNKRYFDKSLQGSIVERNITEPKEKETYPRFISYGKRITIPHLTPDVTYKGMFSMRGRRFVGSGTKEEPAEIIFMRNDKPFLTTSSIFFGITKDNIVTDDARINFALEGGDSIFHPDVELEYNIAKKHVLLIRSSQGLSQAPFFDTYHKVNMFFEEISWYQDQPKMEFRMMEGNTQTVADFESQNFFRPDLYEKLGDPDGTNPLITIANYSKSIKSRDISADALAAYMHVTSVEVRPIIFRLAIIGLVSYDIQTDIMHVEDKLFTFIDNRAGKADYDVIDYHSEDPAKYATNDTTAKDNGIMDLNTYDISISGVERVDVSDSQNVRLYPEHRHLILHKDREATFGGRVQAGKFILFGKQFDFDYADFKVKMKDVDSLMMYANSYNPDSTGKHPLVRVKNTIRHLSGELIVDKTTNKSGLKQLKQYPILISDTNTYVYYDKKNIQNGIYKKDKFYFKADPFTIDSVNTFSNARLHFDGTFYSGDIVPEMRETLGLQPDNSLGFIQDLAAGGLDLYKGKGKLYNKLKLSNEGLIGDGTFKYVTSVSKSDKFVFHPDSMFAVAQSFEVIPQETQPEFPQVNGENVSEHWFPKQNALYVNDLSTPLQCYNKFATFHGRLSVTPDLLSGGGVMGFLRATVSAKYMKLLNHRVTADTSNFALKEADSNGIAFATNNMKADLDFHTRIGQFNSNQSGSVVKFPDNQYIAFLDQFKWNMDQDDIELGSDKKAGEQQTGKDLQLNGTNFISVAPHQDSLQFISGQAKFSTRTKVITAHKVAYVDVADARIVPDSGNVTILKNAYMVPFKNADITANKVTKYYEIYKADVAITSRKNYTGSGTYDFIDGAKNKRPFFFSNIRVDASFQTIASTDIPEKTDFSISPYFKYKGGVTLKASDPFLNFNGSCRIIHGCNEIKIAWVKFSSQVDPNNVQIPVAMHMSEDNLPLAVSSVISNTDSVNIYGAFLSPIVNPKKDMVIIPDTGGFLTYDAPTQQYRIGSKEKLIEQNLPGDYVSLDTRKCVEYGEGDLNLGEDLQAVNVKTVGNMTHYLIPDSVVCNVDMIVNFFFDESAMGKMSDDAKAATTLPPLDVNDDGFKKNLRQIMGKEEGDKLIAKLTLGTVKKLPKELESQLFLSNVRLKWNKETHAYVSEGPIGVGGIGKDMINKEATGVVEIRKRKQGDELNIYLEVAPMHWYFFSYYQGLMSVISSNDAFNAAIASVKSDKKEQKTDKGKFSFGSAESTKKTIFLKRIYGE